MRKKMQELDKDSCIFLHSWIEFYGRPDKWLERMLKDGKNNDSEYGKGTGAFQEYCFTGIEKK